jgi:hypothetical protein
MIPPISTGALNEQRMIIFKGEKNEFSQTFVTPRKN